MDAHTKFHVRPSFLLNDDLHNFDVKPVRHKFREGFQARGTIEGIGNVADDVIEMAAIERKIKRRFQTCEMRDTRQCLSIRVRGVYMRFTHFTAKGRQLQDILAFPAFCIHPVSYTHLGW